MEARPKRRKSRPGRVRAPAGRAARTVALMRRNPWKTISLAVTVFVGIPGIAASTQYIRSAADPWLALHSTSYLAKLLEPIRATQDKHDYAIDYLIQQDARKALERAKQDMKSSPNATTQEIIEKLEKSIKKRQERLDKVDN